MIIDLATLTGACLYAVGPFYTALMSQHDDLAGKVEAAAGRSGDHVWRLPFHDDFKKAIKSPVADISNTGARKYGAFTVTAGHFLKNFVGDVPWVHLDIASTAFNVPDRSYYREGATGSGVRLLVDLAMNWNNTL
jgi:leucyl aminopeptidase